MTSNTKPRPVVGQEVVVARMGSWDMHYDFGYVVTKVTPSGQVVVKHPEITAECRFNADHREVGVDRYRAAELRLDVQELQEREARQKRSIDAVNLIHAVRTTVQGRKPCKTLLQEEIQELEEKLAAAKAAVEAI